jgi:hypothetical protein
MENCVEEEKVSDKGLMDFVNHQICTSDHEPLREVSIKIERISSLPVKGGRRYRPRYQSLTSPPLSIRRASSTPRTSVRYR